MPLLASNCNKSWHPLVSSLRVDSFADLARSLHYQLHSAVQVACMCTWYRDGVYRTTLPLIHGRSIPFSLSLSVSVPCVLRRREPTHCNGGFESPNTSSLDPSPAAVHGGLGLVFDSLSKQQYGLEPPQSHF